MLPGPEWLLGLADIAVLAIVAGITVYILRLPRVALLAPAWGRSMLIAGVAFTLLVHLLEAFWLAPVVANGPDGQGGIALPAAVSWVFSRAAILMIAVGLLIAVRQHDAVEKIARVSQEKVSVAEAQLLQSEERFRSLFETTANAVSCYALQPPMPTSLPLDEQVSANLDAVLVECNEAFARDVGFQKPADVIGTSFRSNHEGIDRDTAEQFIRDYAAGGYRLSDYEIVFRDAHGAERAVSLSVTGIVQDGYLVRAWTVARNINDVRHARRALSRRRRFQELLADISSRLVMAPVDDADDAMLGGLQAACEFIGGNRYTLIWIDWDREVAETLYSWREDGSTAHTTVDVTNYPFVAEQLRNGASMCVADVASLPAAAEADMRSLQELGLKAFLILPLIVAREVVGAVTVGNDREYCDWSDQDVLDLKVFAQLFASYVLRLRQRRALDSALERLRDATERLEAENVYLRNEIRLTNDFDEIVGESESLRRSLQQVEQVADTMTPVLVLGETGTGKELIARALHEHSSRRHRPLVKVNCAALPANLIESELFGYEKGAFTSADAPKRGRFDLADGSTLFLDEIGEIPIELQAKLLRVLQDGEFERLGGNRTIRVDVRIVAATNRDLRQASEDGEFRSDLYYRISTFPIELPPLRERKGDIRLLAEHFVQLHSQRLGREVSAISARMIHELESYDWPGNVRELEGVVQRALISCSGPVLELGHPLVSRNAAGLSSSDELKAVERDHIVAVLDETRWKIAGKSGAASRLGIPPSTLRSKMKKLGIDRPA